MWKGTVLMKPNPPFVSGLPVIGNILDFGRDRQALFRRGYEQFGPVFAFKLGPKPAAMLIGPEYHKLFFTETDKSLRMDKAYTFLRASFGDIAFAAPPEVYYEQRPILHAPFKRAKMPRYIEIMQDEIQAWLDSLGDSGEMELVTELTTVIQNVAAHALMGKDFKEQVGAEFWALYMDIGRALDPMLPPNLPLPKFRRRDRAKVRMREILRPLIEARRASPEGHDDFLQEFLEVRYKDDREVEDEIIIGMILALMFAGHETTVGQGAWTVIQMLQHPAYLALAQQEIDAQLPPGTTLSLETIGRLRHLEWAVRETGRMHPSADILMREAETALDVGEYTIPAGWLVFVASETAHFLPELFQQAEAYNPLRYAPGQEEDKQHRYALIPFGGGVHKCAGMNFANAEMLIIAALLLQQYDLELVTQAPGVQHGVGANRPEPTTIRYRRKAI